MSKEKYLAMYTKVYNSKLLCEWLRTLSKLSVAACVASVCIALPMVALGTGLFAAVRLLTVLAVPFAAVTVARRIINAKRPYEVYELSSLGVDTSRLREGRSFPSRHVFSGFLIATALLPTLPTLGVMLLLLSAVLGTARVLLGIHFIRDAVLGAVLGSAAALLGLLILGV